MSEFSNSLWSGSCSSEYESQHFDSSKSSCPDSSTGQKSRSTSPDIRLDVTKRPPYSFHAIIAMALQSSPHKRMRFQEIYDYISTNFPYYKAKNSFGWKSSVRHNLPIHSRFQKVKSEVGTGNYWEITCDFGTDVFIGEKRGKLHRSGNFRCSDITQSEDKSLFLGSSLLSTPDSSTEHKSNFTLSGLDMDSTKRPPYSFNSIIAMAIQSSPQKRMRLQEIYDCIFTNFLYYRAQKSLGWQNSVRQNLSFHSHFQKVRAEDGQGNYWEMTCDFGTDVFIGEKSGNLFRRENSKEQLAPPPPVPMDLPNIPLMPNPFFYNPATMMLQNQILIQMMIENYQLQQSIQGSAAIGPLPIPPFLINKLPKKDE